MCWLVRKLQNWKNIEEIYLMDWKWLDIVWLRGAHFHEDENLVDCSRVKMLYVLKNINENLRIYVQSN